MNKDSLIYVAGHRGLAGSAIVRCLQRNGYNNLVSRTSSELDLREQGAVRDFFNEIKPEYVFLAAGKVGGIRANIENPAPFLYDNLIMQCNIIHEAYKAKVKKILVLGSSCIYPAHCPQPMKEEYLMDGKLEPTNEGYALSKVVALKMAYYYHLQYGFNAVSIMPPNLYGYNDSFDPLHSHVLSATVKKFVDAVMAGNKEVMMWGTGNARREFMNVEDLADAALYVMLNYNEPDFVNIGWGTDVSIRELAELIAKQAGFEGKITWDPSKPDGMMRKCMDVARMKKIGFAPSITLEMGVKQMIEYYKTKIQ